MNSSVNGLLCIGCDAYRRVRRLKGSEREARDVFDLLTRDGEGHTQEFSQLLLSPTLDEIRKALNIAFPKAMGLEVFTFFFAGHAAVRGGGFYLCPCDTESERLSTTAFPIVDLFSIINEFRPIQVNIVVDACESGGASLDLSQLLKPEIVGSSEATSITFLGACASDQTAKETAKGGALTRELVKCLRGEVQIQTKWPFLDLIEIGRIVSGELQKNHANQKPITWGLNLFGNSRFARNPCYQLSEVEPQFPIGGTLASTIVGKRFQIKSSALWHESRLIGEAFDPRRLLNLLEDVFRDMGKDRSDAVPYVQALANTLSGKAKDSHELLAPSQCLGTCAVFLLPSIFSKAAQEYAREVLQEMLILDLKSWREMLDRLTTEKYFLLGSTSPIADLYYLPLRITKTLGWIGFSTILVRLLPEFDDKHDEKRFELVESILNKYENSFVTVSDEQGPYLYVILKACEVAGRRELAERITNLYFASFAARGANVTRANVGGRVALQYLLSLGPEQHRPKDLRPANPSSLLAVLLLWGSRLQLEATWDLRALDRKSSNFYIPESHLSFGDEVIDGGVNHTHRIGFGIWKLSEFRAEMDRALNNGLSAELQSLPREAIALCAAASLLFPDRLPLLLERAL